MSKSDYVRGGFCPFPGLSMHLLFIYYSSGLKVTLDILDLL